MIVGYIYIRSNKYWDIDNVYKFGQIDNIFNIEKIYRKNEFTKGHYKMIIEIPFDIEIKDNEKSKKELKEQLGKIEKDFENYFIKFNIKKNGGNGFYDKSILSKIENYFIENKIKCKFLSEIKIEELIEKK
jgi:hypothetical protein